MNVWRDRLHRWFAPMARRCPISPNGISLIALVLNLIAAALLLYREFLIAIVFVTIGGLADAFDGIVARVQNKATRFGDFLDHFLDRVSDTALFTGWLLGSAVRPEIALLGIIAIMLNGYIGTQLEATWHERNYDSVGRSEFVLALVIFPLVSHIVITNSWQLMLFGGLRITEWMTLLLVLGAALGIGQRLALARGLERG
jgi:phosphatidylglycerophosphate synthase